MLSYAINAFIRIHSRPCEAEARPSQLKKLDAASRRGRCLEDYIPVYVVQFQANAGNLYARCKPNKL